MKKLMLACALLCAPITLTACATIPTSPSDVTNTTKLDEQAVIAADLAYKSFRLAVETGVEAGLIKGELARKLAELDNQLFTAYIAVDAAYRTANAETLADAIVIFNGLLAQANVLLGSK